MTSTTAAATYYIKWGYKWSDWTPTSEQKCQVDDRIAELFNCPISGLYTIVSVRIINPLFNPERVMFTETPLTPQTAAMTTADVPITQPAAMQVLSSTSDLPPPQTVTIPIDQLNAFVAMQARLAKVEEDRQRHEAAAREEQVKTLAAKGQVEEALRTQREEGQRALEAERGQRAQAEERAKRYALDGELARALGSHPLVSGGAEQLTQLLRDHFLVEPQGNSFHVRTQDFKSVGDYIGTILGRPEFAHFLRAQNPGGGSGSRGGALSAPTSPANPTAPVEPKNFSEAVIMQMAAAAKTTADPRLTPTIGFGLRGLTLTAKTA